jgi:hypothetical protein
MKTSVVIKLAALACLGFGASAHAECAFPKAPATIPDGKTASEPEMVAAMNAFKAYNQEVVDFGKCLDEEAASSMAAKTMKSKKISAAQEELQAKAKLFNEQVRIFKARG